MSHRNLVAERVNDDFDTLDSDTWVLGGDATYTSDRVRLTPATDNTFGVLELRDDFNPNVWETSWRFDISNPDTTSGYSVNLLFYTDEVDYSTGIPKNEGYFVEYQHQNGIIRLWHVDNGDNKELASANVAIPDADGDRNFARVEYTRGEVDVYLNGERVLSHTIEDPNEQYAELAYTARNFSNHATHHVDEIRLVAATDRNIKTAQDAWDNGGIEFGNTANAYKLVRALLSVADQEDKELNEIKRARHIDTAKGEELDRFGDLVQLDRKTGESDKKYRARLKVQYRVGNIGTTFNQFAEFSSVVLDTNVNNIEFIFDFETDDAVVQVAANPNIYESNILTATEVEEFLGGAVPAGHEVQVLERGTFRLKADGDVDDPDKGLTSDGINTGGTLAGDLLGQ